VDTIVNTNVKRSKVFGLAFVKVTGVTDVFTQDEVRAFVLPKLSELLETLVGSAIVQLDNVSSGESNHSGRGDERFTGVLTKVFSNGIVDDTVTTNATDVTGTAGVDVYFLTVDGINETAVRSSYLAPFTFTIDGNEYSRSASDPLYQITLDEDTDADLTKTPWVLVLNYVHLGGTNPPLNIRDTTKGLPVLPETGSSLDFNTLDISAVDYPNGSISDPGSWGHTDNDLFNKTCIALGSPSGNDHGVEVRFVGKTNAHTRIINFKTSKFEFLKHFRYGDQPRVTGVSLTEGTDFTLLDNHTAVLPTGINRLYSGSGDEAMTNHPFHITGARMWNIGSTNRWEVDDHLIYNKNTYHQIWVRAKA
jgi:hypothetical protein